MPKACLQLRVILSPEQRRTLGDISWRVARCKTLIMQQWRMADANTPTRVPDPPPRTQSGNIDWHSIFGRLVGIGKKERDYDLEEVYTYPIARRQFPELATPMIVALTQDVRAAYKRWRIALLMGKRQTPEYRRDSPVPIKDNTAKMRFSEDGNRLLIDFPVFSNKAPQPGRMTVTCWIERLSDDDRKVLAEYASGDRRIPRLLLHCRRRKNRKRWFLDVPVDRDAEYAPYLPGRILEIRAVPKDEGFLVLRLAGQEIRMDGNLREENIEYQSVLAALSGLDRRRISIQNKYRCDPPAIKKRRHGHGYRRTVETFEWVRVRRRNTVCEYNRRTAAYIVDVAVSWQCQSISMEKLSDRDPQELVLGEWFYSEIERLVQEYAAKYNMEVKLWVRPKVEVDKKPEDGESGKAIRKGPKPKNGNPKQSASARRVKSAGLRKDTGSRPTRTART